MKWHWKEGNIVSARQGYNTPCYTEREAQSGSVTTILGVSLEYHLSVPIPLVTVGVWWTEVECNSWVGLQATWLSDVHSQGVTGDSTMTWNRVLLHLSSYKCTTATGSSWNALGMLLVSCVFVPDSALLGSLSLYWWQMPKMIGKSNQSQYP